MITSHNWFDRHWQPIFIAGAGVSLASVVLLIAAAVGGWLG